MGHGGRHEQAQGVEEAQGPVDAGAGGDLRHLSQHDLAHRKRPAGGTPPHHPQAGRGARGGPRGTAEGGVRVSKRGNGEGTISRRKNGGWMAQYYVYTVDGRRRKTLYGKTRNEVSAKLTKAMADRDGG